VSTPGSTLIRSTLIDAYHRRMTRFVGAAEAARQLGVERATLYAYVSRGMIERRVAVDGRTSLYSVDDLDALALRTRRRDVEQRPSLDVQIATRITVLAEEGVRYFGHDVAELARTCSYERVAELLWTGTLPPTAHWPPPVDVDVEVARRAAAASSSVGVAAIGSIAFAFNSTYPGDGPATAARRLVGVLPDVFAAPGTTLPDGPFAARLAEAWLPGRGETIMPAVDRSLVLLADHELATSTLAVRLAASVRASAHASFAAGLTVLLGALHGGAATLSHRFLADCERDGVGPTIARRLAGGERLPGFGHKIYAGEDPRLRPLMEAVDSIPGVDGRRQVVAEVLVETGARLTRRPNVDLGLGALTFVGGLPQDLPLFAVARLAGFTAHILEELEERPLRYRGIARPGS
jgi:citrate synthase